MLDPNELADALAAAPIELIVFATDVSERRADGSYELAYSSHETPPETMAQAVLASAAISALVLPLAGRRPDRHRRRLGPKLPARLRARAAGVELVVAFRHVPRYPPSASSRSTGCAAACSASAPSRPCARLIAQLDEAESREPRGEPVHLGDMIDPADAGGDSAEHGAGGAARRGARAACQRARGTTRRPGPASRATRAAGPARRRHARSRSGSHARTLPRNVPRIIVRGVAAVPTASSRASASSPSGGAREAGADRARLAAAARRAELREARTCGASAEAGLLRS